MKKGLGRVLCVLAILYMTGMTVCAADAGTIKKDMVLQTNSDVDLHEKPDASSAITATLQNGTPVVIGEDEKDGWCLAAFRENTGYVQTSFLRSLGSQDELDSEFRNIKEESILTYREAETAKQHIVSTRIWGIVIVVLVVAIFGAGIVSAMKKR